MTCREIHETDLVDCLNVTPGHAGDEITGREKALDIWAALLKSRGFKGALVESNPPIAGRRIVGFGASIFVSREFATRETGHPRPYLNSRLFEAIARGESVVLSEAGLRAANATEGLELLILAGTWSVDVLTDQLSAQIGTMLAFKALSLHGGYRLNRQIYEVVGDSQRGFYESTGVWQLMSGFGGGRALMVVTRELALSVGASVAASMFSYRNPILELRPAERELLEAALDGATDQELAAKLHLTLTAVKRRWLVLFNRIAESHPALFVEGEGFESQARGKQKRHHLLSYVREHLEEIRP